MEIGYKMCYNKMNYIMQSRKKQAIPDFALCEILL